MPIRYPITAWYLWSICGMHLLPQLLKLNLNVSAISLSKLTWLVTPHSEDLADWVSVGVRSFDWPYRLQYKVTDGYTVQPTHLRTWITNDVWQIEHQHLQINFHNYSCSMNFNKTRLLTKLIHFYFAGEHGKNKEKSKSGSRKLGRG